MLTAELMRLFKPNTAHHHLYCFDAHHRLQSCNDQQAIDVGFARESEIIGKAVWNLYVKESDANLYILNNESVMRAGRPIDFFEKTTLDNSVIHLRTHKSPLKNRKGKVIGIIGISVPTDINHDLKLLSPQQLKCLQFLMKGMSAKDIAKNMHLSTRTVEHYLSDIRLKLRCKNSKELIAFGNSRGII